MVFIDRLRKAIKDFCSKGIREKFEDVTDEDVDKMYLMLEHNFFVGITSDDSEWDINTIKVDEVQFLINSGVDPKTVSKRLGHSDTSITMEIYTHSFEESKNACADRFDEMMKKLEIA